MMHFRWHILALGSFVLVGGCPPDKAATSADAGEPDKPDAGGHQAMCAARAKQGSAAVTPAVEAHQHCTTAADCSIVSVDTYCHNACGALVGEGGAAAVKAAVDAANQGICRDFEDDGCFAPIPPCLPPSGTLACMGKGAAAHCVEVEGSARTDAGTDGGEDDACVASTLAWRQDGGLVAYYDQHSLSPCRGFALARTTPGSEGKVTAQCENEIAASAEVSVADVNAALAHADVVAALAGSTVLYGGDPRVLDGTVFHLELEGHVLEVGSDCGQPTTCPIPPGLLVLRETLDALGAQQRALDSCKALQ